MNAIVLNLLGPFLATVDGQPITDFATDKVRALLSYLALEAGHPQARASLAALLWPQLPSEKALDNLRKSIYRLRQTFERSAPNAAPPVVVIRQTLHFVAPPSTVDVLTFQALLAETLAHEHPSIAGCDACLARLTQAMELYRGELLAGFGLPDAPAFEEWLLLWRESLRRQALAALMFLGNAWEERGDLPRSNLLVVRILHMEPYHEEAHRLKMRLLSRMGTPQQALAHYEAYKRLLKHELKLEPDEATNALAKQLRPEHYPGENSQKDPVLAEALSEKPALPSPYHPQSPFHPRSNVPEYGHIYGRQHDLERLSQWLTQDRCRLIALFGMGGIGKTTLAAAAVHSVAAHFDIVLWRSLINAPPLDEILLDWLKILSGDTLAHLPESLDAQIAQLLDCLRQRRCLLVLDNLESIFQAGQAGEMRPEHQGYAHLILRLGELQHRSCLLLTSREQPPAFVRLEDDLHHVRSLPLEGLDVAAAQAMLQDRGLAKVNAGATSLATLYSGNPLALKVVAETVLELFGGDIESFLATKAIIFEDIREVLDWQFERLSALEQEILLWLAVEREPLSLAALRANLTPPRPAVEVLAALRGLQRRSLLEQALSFPDFSAMGAEMSGGTEKSGAYPAGAGQTEIRFMLQNVLMEYLTDRLIGIAYEEIQQEKLVHLHRHALIKAQASEYVRQSQVRLILRPLAERLQATLDKEESIRKLSRILAGLHTGLHTRPAIGSGHAAGCLLNLLLLLDADLTGYDFSHLPVWQADLRLANLPAVNFAEADLTHTYFAEGFGLINAVAISPDGALLAAATNNGELRLWHASDGRLLHIFQGYKGTLRSLAFSPNSALLASAGEDGTVRLWNVVDKAPFLSVLKGHMGRVTVIAFHPDGKSLASGGIDQTIRLWDVTTGATTAILHGHEDRVWALDFHPDGATLASAGYDNSVRLWDLQTATERALLAGHTGVVSGVVFAAGGTRLASCSFDGTVRLWDVASGQPLEILAAFADEMNTLAITPDGDFLACGGDDHGVRIWDLRSGAIRHSLYGHDSDILALAFSPDGQTLASGSVDQTVRLWNAPTGQLRQQIIGHSQSIRMVAYHPYGNVVASAHFDHVVRLWNMAEQLGKLEQTLRGHTKAVHAVRISRDGAWLASGGDDQTILVWRLLNPNVSAPMAEKTGKPARRAQRRHTLPSQHGRVTSLAFSPDGATVASGGYGKMVCLWEVASGILTGLLSGHDAPVSGLHFSPDGSLLATISRNQNIRIWDAHNETLLSLWQGHQGFITTVAFTPDGETLVTGAVDGMIYLWDVRVPTQPALRVTLSEHSDRVFSIAMSADGRRMVSGSADRTVRLWEMQSGHLIRTMTGHTREVWTVDITLDGSRGSSGGPDETLRLWDLESGACLAVLTGSGPYDGMNISGASGISQAQKATLLRLGAVEL